MIINRLSVFVLSIFAFLSFSCGHRTGPGTAGSQMSDMVYAREPVDSANYRHIKYDFYLSNTGQLCERKIAMAGPSDSACRCQFVVYYDSTFRFAGSTKPLGSVVDIGTFEWVDGTEFSKDKNHVYYFYANSDGGNRSIIEEADPKTFRRLCEYRWGVDKNHVFYQGQPLGLDADRVQPLYPPDTTDHFVSYVKDDKTVYHCDKKLLGADAATFKTVSWQAWEAEDKYRRYGQQGVSE